MMKQYIKTLVITFYISASCCILYGWNNQNWLGNSERVSVWTASGTADYLRLGVLRDGVYRLASSDISTAFGSSTSNVISQLTSGDFFLSCGTNSIAWTTDGTNLYFYGQATDQLYAPENVYFLRPDAGIVMSSQSAPSDSQSATNTWFMQNSSHRSEFLDVSNYYDRRSSNASIMTELNYGMSLGDSWCNRISCEFSADLPGYTSLAPTNIDVKVHAISYGDYGASSDTHLFELFVEDVSCGTSSWSGEQKVVYEAQVPLSVVTNTQPLLRVTNLTESEHILLLNVEVDYPRMYEVSAEPLLCSGGSESNLCVSGSQIGAEVMAWDITDPLNGVVLGLSVSSQSNGWTTVFGCGDASSRYAVFEKSNCFEPSVTGFSDIDWSAEGAIPSLVIVTPPRRWVSGFEEALEPLVLLRRAQGLGVRVVDAEDIYNYFSHGLVTPHAFQDFVDAGVNSGSEKLRYLLFAGYAATDYKLEVFPPDTEFKSGKKGFPALFPLLQVLQVEGGEYSMLLLPNDVMLGDADSNGMPDVAVGRFLATDAAELSDMVTKTVNHDLKHPWNRAVLISDYNYALGQYSNFSGVTSAFSNELFSAGWDIDYYYCASDYGFPPIWKYFYGVDAWDNLQEGRDFFYYIGHSSDTMIGHLSGPGGYLMKNSDLISADWSYAPAAIFMGCRMGRYTSLDVVNMSTCVMETGVKNGSSGFSSAISAAGYFTYGDAKALTQLISDEINLYGSKRIGDAWVAALDQFGAGDLAENQHLVFLGDPSMPVYKPRYPTIIRIR